MLREAGRPTRVVSLRLLAPLQADRLRDALSGCAGVFVVEQNHSRQLYHYLRGQTDFEQPVGSYAVAGPVPLDAGAIAASVLDELAAGFAEELQA